MLFITDKARILHLILEKNGEIGAWMIPNWETTIINLVSDTLHFLVKQNEKYLSKAEVAQEFRPKEDFGFVNCQTLQTAVLELRLRMRATKTS